MRILPPCMDASKKALRLSSKGRAGTLNPQELAIRRSSYGSARVALRVSIEKSFGRWLLDSVRITVRASRRQLCP